MKKTPKIEEFLARAEELYDENLTYQEIADVMNEEGITNCFGNKVTKRGVQKTLVALGKSKHGDRRGRGGNVSGRIWGSVPGSKMFDRDDDKPDFPDED